MCSGHFLFSYRDFTSTRYIDDLLGLKNKCCIISVVCVKSSKAIVNLFTILQLNSATSMFANFKMINDPWTKTFQAKLIAWC